MGPENRRLRRNKALRIAVDLVASLGGGKVISVTEMPILPGHRPGDATSWRVVIQGDVTSKPETFMIARIDDE